MRFLIFVIKQSSMSRETFTNLIICSDSSAKSSLSNQAVRYYFGTWQRIEQALSSLTISCFSIFEFSMRELLMNFEVSATPSKSLIGTEIALLLMRVDRSISKTPFKSANMTPEERPKLSLMRHSEHVSLD